MQRQPGNEVDVDVDDRLRVQILRNGARAPQRQSSGSAGYDLYACESNSVPPGGWALVDTGIAVAVPRGTYGRVAPRSSLAVRGVQVGAGVVDADYRGTVKVLLFNHGSTAMEVRDGDRIAQLVLERVRTPEVTVVDSLDGTDRGSGGFGSTGR